MDTAEWKHDLGELWMSGGRAYRLPACPRSFADAGAAAAQRRKPLK